MLTLKLHKKKKIKKNLNMTVQTLHPKLILRKC